MVEVFVISLCLSVQEEPCMKAAQAYYQYSGLDKIVNDYSKKHKELAYVASVAGVMKDRKFNIPLTHNIVYKYEYDNQLNFISYGFGF